MNFDWAPQDLFSMRHLHWRRLWLSVGLMLMLAIVVLSIITVPPPVKSIVLHDKLVHTAVYAVLMGWFSQLFRHDLTRLLLVAAFVALGVLMELVQGLTPARQFEWLDMLANTCGVLLAWALAYTRVGNVLPRLEALLRVRQSAG